VEESIGDRVLNSLPRHTALSLEELMVPELHELVLSDFILVLVINGQKLFDINIRRAGIWSLVSMALVHAEH